MGAAAVRGRRWIAPRHGGYAPAEDVPRPARVPGNPGGASRPHRCCVCSCDDGGTAPALFGLDDADTDDGTEGSRG